LHQIYVLPEVLISKCFNFPALSCLGRGVFIGNILNAFLIVLIMAFALHSGNFKTALMEIPFFAMPLILIFLGYPLKK
jgi:hypothetical protein